MQQITPLDLKVLGKSFVKKGMLLFRKVLYSMSRKVKYPFKTQRILVVRFDAIGDYLLFRNFLEGLRSHGKYRGYRISFLGNVSCREFAEYYDSENIDEFIWFDPQLIRKGGLRGKYDRTLLQLIWRIKIKGFDILINPCHSRNIDLDRFVSFLGAKMNIGSVGDSFFFPSEAAKTKNDNCYHNLIEVLDHGNFEFYRNCSFFSNLLNEDLFTKVLLSINVKSVIRKKAIVIFPGAGDKLRQWPISYFIELINEIYVLAGDYEFYIAGSYDDIKTADLIISQIRSATVSNFCGRTSLPEFAELLNKSCLLISNETSAVHMAASLNLPAICISNGNHFGRFNPYPHNLRSNILTVYPHDNFYDSYMREDLVEQNKGGATMSIDLIKPKTVIENVLIALGVTA